MAKTVSGLKRGQQLVAETTSGNFGQGAGRGQPSPAKDWSPTLVGPSHSLGNAGMRQQLEASISSAYGVHPAWFAAAATAPGIRECKRLAFLSATLPLARIIADELSSKLETRIEIEWPNMANESVDVHLRARAFAAIVSAGEGQSPTYAAAVAGLPIPPAEDDEIRMAQHTRRHEDSKEHGESTSYENGRFLGPREQSKLFAKGFPEEFVGSHIGSINDGGGRRGCLPNGS